MRRSALLTIGLVWVLSSGAPASDGADGEACLVHQSAAETTDLPAEVTWWLLRKGDRVETRRADGQLGEVWTRSVAGASTYVRLDHVERVSIEYTSGDLTMMGIDAPDSWIWNTPLPIEQTTRAFDQPVRLRLECGPLLDSTVALTAPEQLDRYRRVDFIDLGDMEGDAQLQRVIRRQGS
jgi:hypothetical protein